MMKLIMNLMIFKLYSIKIIEFFLESIVVTLASDDEDTDEPDDIETIQH